ncbi:MAG TPA: aldo/keto reductase [Pseudomonas xinjiangensis]|uniref:Aldo/keto reductase n=2 Tax=root TaxID=1 RepID=A0A7V1BQD5_9GAMM|nr:aldo/keto reductase [Halopseudomonas xinjiangensis]HEC48473.1 aldo/keto reductase [Halopseudomonas xinjiangensis]
MQRRTFLSTVAISSAGLALTPLLAQAQTQAAPAQASSPGELPMNSGDHKRYRPSHRVGLGGAIGLGDSRREMSEREALGLLHEAWDQGIRYYDTSPWYGLGLSERRHAMLLSSREHDAYVASSKTGRLLKPEPGYSHDNWKGVNHFAYEYDYSASATRRSIEDSLQRMGVPNLDMVFIHDLSPDNEDISDNWKEYFDVAVKGAMPELVKMREEGLIKGWGMGVNTLPPARGAIEQSDPDIILLATQYSLLKHDDALNNLFPLAEQRDVSFVLGAPLNSGYLAGNEYYNYSKDVPDEIRQKREQYRKLAGEHNVDLRTAALQFCNAPAVVASVLHGASRPEHVRENVASMSARVPGEFWNAAKQQGLIEQNAPTPS